MITLAVAAAVITSLSGGIAMADQQSSNSNHYVTAAITTDAYERPLLSSDTIGRVFAGQVYEAQCKTLTEEAPNSWVAITRNHVTGFVPTTAFSGSAGLPVC